MAHLQPLVERVRPGSRAAELGPPVPGYRQQPRVQSLLQPLDGLRVRGPEVPVLALTEPVPAHVDRAAEAGCLIVETADLLRLGRSEQLGQQGAAQRVDLSRDGIPVSGPDPILPRITALLGSRDCAHAALPF